MNYVDLSDDQMKALIITAKPFALASFVSACVLLSDIGIRNKKEKGKRLYHRLIMAISAASLILSVTQIFGTFTIPSKYQNLYLWAYGNELSCQVQGFISFGTSVSTMLYYVALSLYALLSIHYDFSQDKYIGFEKWIHLAALSIPTILSSILIKLRMFNPTTQYCWVSPPPEGCDSDSEADCVYVEAKSTSDVYVIYFYCVPLIICIVTATLLILAAYYIHRKKEAVLERMGGGNHYYLEQARITKSRMVLKQARLHLLSLYATFALPSLPYYLRETQEKTSMFVCTTLLYLVIFNSQGVMIMIAYYSLQFSDEITTMKRRRSSAIRRTSSTIKPVVSSNVGLRDSSSIDPNALCTIVKKEKEDDEQTQKKAAANQSIFDGTNINPSCVWKEFLFADDDISSPSERSEGTNNGIDIESARID